MLQATALGITPYAGRLRGSYKYITESGLEDDDIVGPLGRPWGGKTGLSALTAWSTWGSGQRGEE